MTTPIKGDDGGRYKVWPVTRWCTSSEDRKVIFLTLEYLEGQEGMNRAYTLSIQLGLNPKMCRELGAALVKIANRSIDNSPSGPQPRKPKK